MVEAELDDESEGEEDKELEVQQDDEPVESPFVFEKPYQPAEDEEDCKDQGFTRPKVLILTGYKNMAYKIVNEIILQLNCGSWRKVIKRKRFKKEFDPMTEEAVNDCFKIGLSIINNEQIKLYENLIDSDIIIASPLGLRMITGQDGEQENRREYDFLSSVQIVILDQAETFLYQNTEHLEEVLKSTNKVPKTLDILNDITRIQDIYLEKLGRNFRQSIVLQEFRSTDIDFVVKSYCSTNYAGCIEMNRIYTRNILKEHSLSKNIKITLRRLNTDSLELVDETRYTFFTKKLWKKLYENLGFYTIVVASSYFEFVRLRSFMKDKNASVAYICEYSSESDCQRNRALYEAGKKKFMLITERALFFQIVKLRYARNLIFYSLPDCTRVLEDLIVLNTEKGAKFVLTIRKGQRKKGDDGDNTVDEEKKLVSGESVIFGLFSIFDELKLERLVGTDRYRQIIYNKTKDTFQFM